jgi:hypothetical protein
MAQDPNEKLEKEGNTTKGNMGEGRLSIDAIDKLLKRGKYAPEKTDKTDKTDKKVEKKSNGGAVHTMPDGTKMKGAKHGMKHGGAVKGKKCRMDGIAIRGKTRAKQRSK